MHFTIPEDFSDDIPATRSGVGFFWPLSKPLTFWWAVGPQLWALKQHSQLWMWKSAFSRKTQPRMKNPTWLFLLRKNYPPQLPPKTQAPALWLKWQVLTEWKKKDSIAVVSISRFEENIESQLQAVFMGQRSGQVGPLDAGWWWWWLWWWWWWWWWWRWRRLIIMMMLMRMMTMMMTTYYYYYYYCFDYDDDHDHDDEDLIEGKLRSFLLLLFHSSRPSLEQPKELLQPPLLNFTWQWISYYVNA